MYHLLVAEQKAEEPPGRAHVFIEAIRKVVQNTIDGAVGWLQQDEDSNCTSSSSSFPGKQKSDVRPGGEGWNTINEGKPSKWTKTTKGCKK